MMQKPQSENPIVLFIRELLDSGKITKEKICVVADLKFPTLDNLFNRPNVSFGVKKALAASGIVPAKIIQQYDVWFHQTYLPEKKRSKNGHTSPSPRHKNKSARETDRVEEVGTVPDAET